MMKTAKDCFLALVAIVLFIPVMILWLIMLAVLTVADSKSLSLTDY